MLGVLDCAAAELISEMALINTAYLLCAAMFERSRGFGVLGYCRGSWCDEKDAVPGQSDYA